MSALTRVAVSAAAVAAALTLSSCSTSPDSADLGLPAKNQSEWVLPLDSYMMNEQEISTMQYAWTLLSAACMNTAGYDLGAPGRQEAPLSESPSWNAVGRYLFNADTAAQFGYHLAPSIDPALSADWYDFKHTEYSDSELSALRSCQKEAWSALPDIDQQDDVLANFGAQASSAAQEDEKVLAAEQDWSACMEPLGVSDIPTKPSDMPATSQLDAFGMAGDVAGSLASAATATEREQAAFDANCRESSGYDDVLYAAEWKAQVQVLNDNLDDIRRGRSLISEFDDEARRVIAENAAAA